MSRTRGFTLIEVLVALALAGMIVAGAFQMHLAFNRQSQRQQQVAEIQQTLRVAMQIIERAIRQAGGGLGATHMLPTASCATQDYYGFQYSDDNTFADPKTTYTSGSGALDTDPDWFRVVYSDSLGDGGATLQSHGAVFTQFISKTPQTWNVNDLFIVLDPCNTPPPGCNGQIRQVTSYSGNGSAANPGVVKHQKGGSCYNLAPGNCPNCDKCLGNFGCASPGAPMRHIAGGGTVYRIMTPADQGDTGGANALASPKLTMRSAPFGTSFTDATYQWIPLADNIEDMQIAVILQNGTVCGDGKSTVYDDPTPAAGAARCDFSQAAAVRVTLVGRSAQPLQGVPPSPQGGYEDRPSTMPAANSRDAYYLRRALTSTIELRNYQGIQ